jgi:hypothetical protein
MMSFDLVAQPRFQLKQVGSVLVSACLVLLVAALVFVTGCSSSSDTAVAPSPVVSAVISLTPEAEVPPVNPSVPVLASGTANVTLNSETGNLSVSGNFANLTSPLFDVSTVGPVHIHIAQQMPFAQNTGPVVFVPDVNETPGRLSGSFVLTTTVAPEQVNAFLAGAYYINIHTDVNNSGELRGQIVFP